MKIGKTEIGDNHPTFIIAEMSANHGHDINKAKELLGYQPRFILSEGISKAMPWYLQN